jgi:pimeloyl-ACP methyl ester carboxylesterase
VVHGFIYISESCLVMQNLLDSFSQVTPFYNSFFGISSSTNTMSLLNIGAFGSLTKAGILSASYSYSQDSKAVCVSGTVDIPVTGPVTNVLYDGPANNFELTEWITNFLRRGSDTFQTNVGATVTVSDTFTIFVRLCVPADKEKTKNLSSVQLLTHGGTTDYTYWDFAPGYSYVDAAAEKGYATFSYDRLGTGKSEHPDPKQRVQAPIQAELAHVLVQRLKEGKYGGIKFSKVVGVGHSLGSAVTMGTSATHPEDFDAVVLTGHSHFAGGGGIGFAAAAQQIANTLPDRPQLKNLPNGYFTLGPIPQTLQFAFFYYPHFNLTLFKKEFDTRQTNAIGETLTLGGLYVPAPAYNKPVQILNGQQDFFYCQGNCRGGGSDITAEALALFYPNAPAAKSQAVTLPTMGHNINLHYGRLDAFAKMLSFISGAGVLP